MNMLRAIDGVVDMTPPHAPPSLADVITDCVPVSLSSSHTAPPVAVLFAKGVALGVPVWAGTHITQSAFDVPRLELHMHDVHRGADERACVCTRSSTPKPCGGAVTLAVTAQPISDDTSGRGPAGDAGACDDVTSGDAAAPPSVDVISTANASHRGVLSRLEASAPQYALVDWASVGPQDAVGLRVRSDKILAVQSHA